MTIAVDVERAEFNAAVISEYKMISSCLGLIHLIGRIAGRRERGGEDGGIGGGVGRIGEGSESEDEGGEVRV